MCTDIEYLVLLVIKYGIIPLEYKVKAIYSINDIDIPNKVHHIRWFVGIVNYYQDMWHKHTHTLHPLKNDASLK